jgi:hypothetical protein
MLVVETVAKIRRLHLVQGLAIKAICRELGLSRKVVRKVLRSGATEFRYERTRQPMPKLGAWQGELDRLLEENAGRASRERLTLMRVFEALRGWATRAATTRCGGTRGVGEAAARGLAGAKKGDMADAAAGLLAGTGWVPRALRVPSGGAADLPLAAE